jgi:hypothetical protein
VGERLVRLAINVCGVVLGYLVAFGLLSCSDLRPAIVAADTTRATGHALAAVVDEMCTKPALAAEHASEEEAARVVARLEALRCPEALHAQTALSEAHGAMVALIAAVEAGQCHATVASPAPARCDLARASMRLVEAAARFGRAVDHLEAMR